MTVKSRNGKSDTIKICVSQLYSEWSFIFLYSVDDDHATSSEALKEKGMSEPTIRFWENQFELVWEDYAYCGTWNRTDDNTGMVISAYNLVLTDGGEMKAIIYEMDDGISLSIFISEFDTINFSLK